jgi:sodium-dependent dicarboxylate transporter 2/3/5
MADSRRYAQMILGKVFFPFFTRLSTFTIVLLASIGLVWILPTDELNNNQIYVLFLLFFAVGLWFTEAIPPFAVGILILVYLVYFLSGRFFHSVPMDVSQYVNTWSSPVIWLLLGGFFIAESLKKSQLDKSILKWVLGKLGSKPSNVLLGLMMLTFIASMLMSNTATTAMVLAAIIPLCNSLGKDEPFTHAILLGIPSAAALGGMGTIIGSPTNAIAVGALNAAGGDVSFAMWMIYGLVPGLLLAFILWKFLVYKFPARVHKIEVTSSLGKDNSTETADVGARRITIATMFLTVAMWITTPFHKIPVAVIAAIPLVFLTVSGVLNALDLQKMPWDTLMLVSGGLALGLALQDTGLAEIFVSKLKQFDIPAIPMIIVICFATMLMSNVMSNTAASTIIVPLAIILLPKNAEIAAVAIGLSASTALFLPVSTPPNALAYATGLLEQKDFRVTGILIGLLGPILILSWVWLANNLFG